MNDPQINPRFRDLMPPLVEGELALLEESILLEGIREPLRVWLGQIIDGHNRWRIAEKHGLPYRTVEELFLDEDEVCEWIITNQLGRRNLEPQLKTLYIGQLYELQKKREGATAGNQRAAKTLDKNNVETVTQLNPVRTSEQIAKQFEITEKTVRNAGKVHQAFEQSDETTKEKFKRGEVTQKALVESAKPKPTVNDLDNAESDNVTRLCKEYGTRYLKLFRDFDALTAEARTAFQSQGATFFDFSGRITKPNFMEPLEIDARILKRFVKCPVCDAKKCEHCKQRGYIDGDKKAQVLDRVEYIKSGGITA